MSIVDIIKAKLLDKIQIQIGKLIIGVNKEEKKITIQVWDKSTHIHYHNDIGISNEDIFRLPSQDLGDLIKHKTFLNFQNALNDNPEKMGKYLAMYNPAALITGACFVTAQTSDIILRDVPMLSKDFVSQLPGAIETSIPRDPISIDEIVLTRIKNKKRKRKVKNREVSDL